MIRPYTRRVASRRHLVWARTDRTLCRIPRFGTITSRYADGRPNCRLCRLGLFLSRRGRTVVFEMLIDRAADLIEGLTGFMTNAKDVRSARQGMR